MKNRVLHKTTLLVALLFAFCSLSAQNLNYDFEQCNVGDKVAETLGEPWTTWDFSPGSEEDAIVSDEHCMGTRALKIDNGNDCVLMLGDNTSGVYRISFDMYIPEGKEAYFNIMGVFEEDEKSIYLPCYFKTEEQGTWITMIGDFDVPYEEWFNIDMIFNVDCGVMEMRINNDLIGNALYKSNLAAIDFFPLSTNQERNGFFVDNILFKEIEGPYVYNIVSENERIDLVMQKDECDTISNTFTNEGNIVDRIFPDAWIDYGVGPESNVTRVLHYDSDPYWTYGNYNDNPYIEVGVVFYADYLLDSVMMIGMKIKEMQYYVNGQAAYGMEGPLTFRIYSTSFDGDVIAEKTLYEYTYNAWNTIEFDEPIPLRGHPICATVGFQQVNGGYPISLDAGPSRRYTADYVRLNGVGWFSLNANGGNDYGNHNIRLICDGLPVETQWVRRISVSNHYVLLNILSPGQTEITDFVFNTSGMDYGEYEAVMRAGTHNAENTEIAIPIKLKVSGADVDEFAENKYKVYPNPATDVLFIEGQNLKHVAIYNAIGEMVKVLQIDNNSININNLENGIYFICIIDSNGAKTIQKVIISK